MLSLWRLWQRGDRLAWGRRKWEQIFGYLRDIRPWGVRDRLLDTGVLDDWKERVKHNEEILPCEIELWFRRDPDMRITARNLVADLVTAQQGHIINEAVIRDIAYHALLVELPVAAVSQIIEGTVEDTALVHCEQIQFFRATGQMAGILADDERTTDDTEITEPETVLRDPVVALLDGLPLQNHRRLAGRLIVDDPDNIESQYQVHYFLNTKTSPNFSNHVFRIVTFKASRNFVEDFPLIYPRKNFSLNDLGKQIDILRLMKYSKISSQLGDPNTLQD